MKSFLKYVQMIIFTILFSLIYSRQLLWDSEHLDSVQTVVRWTCLVRTYPSYAMPCNALWKILSWIWGGPSYFVFIWSTSLPACQLWNFIKDDFLKLIGFTRVERKTHFLATK